MRIVFDCFKQVKGAGKSIGIYNLALNLVKNLVRYKRTSTDEKILRTELIVLGNRYNRGDFDITGVRFVCIDAYDPLNKIHCAVWELSVISNVCRKLTADKVIFPRGYCALTHPVKDIVIIHDLIPFYYKRNFPDTFNKIENAYIINRLRSSARTCYRIVTISEASKRDIIKYCQVDESKIRVIHNGCNEMTPYKEKEDGNEPYICAITSGLPHKNAKGILRSYERYCEISKAPLDLVVIGIGDLSCYGLPEDVKARITYWKFIKDNEEMHRIIANSVLLLFLPLIEGFGYPPIEAMQLKTPVICSNIDSLSEVVDDAAILVDPKDPREVA